MQLTKCSSFEPFGLHVSVNVNEWHIMTFSKMHTANLLKENNGISKVYGYIHLTNTSFAIFKTFTSITLSLFPSFTLFLCVYLLVQARWM
jgi:hypothetical protein